MARKRTERHPVDVEELARGIGKVRSASDYDRIIGADDKTLAYVRRTGTVTVPADLIKGAPKKLGSFTVEANGRWAGAKVTDTAQARKIIEYVAARKEEA